MNIYQRRFENKTNKLCCARLPDNKFQRASDCALLVHRLGQISTVAWKPIYLRVIVLHSNISITE